MIASPRCLVFAFTALLPFVCNGTTWYVDDSATGANNGTSWANAWTDLSVVSMSSLSPGDTVEIAAGDYQGMTCNRAGAPNAPITFKVTSDPTYQGHVYINSGINIYADYVTLDGAFDPGYPVPAAVDQLDSITNNIGMHITDPDSTAINVASGERTGVRLLWIHVYEAGNLDKDFPASGEPAEYAVSLKDVQTDFECAYSWFQDNIYGDTFNSPRTHNGWGAVSIHDCLIYNVGDDAFQINGGFDVYRCKISLRTWGYASGHTDAFQTWGRRVRIHHNIIKDFNGEPGSSGYASLGYIQMSEEHNGDFMFYNNLIYDQSEERMGAPGLKFSHDAWWAPGKYLANNTISNIVVVNNLFLKPAAQVFAHAFTWVASDASRGTNDLFTIEDCLFVNNIILHSLNQDEGQLQGVVAAWPTHTDLTTPNSEDGGRILSDFDRYQVKNNLVVGPNSNVYAGNAFHSSIASVSAMWPNASGNGTAEPAFVDYVRGRQNPQFDFRLAAEDTFARDEGLDLSAYVSQMPMLDEDLNGNPRGYNGAWDIGPYEYAGDAASSLLLHIDFDDTDWTRGYLEDRSGRGNHGYEFGHGNQQNWPTIASRAIDGGGSSQCGEFHWEYDPTIDTYLRSGDYLAVTNLQDFGVMSQMTVSAWAYYDTSRDTNGNPVSWTADGEACIVSAGYATTNAWELARTGTLAPKVKLFHGNNSASYTTYGFQYTFDSNGKSDTWHHYAFVFDNGILTLYQDGQPWSTNQHALSTIGVAGGWIGIGCKTHGATVHSTPQFGDDLYPNHGWMNGMIDDVRIYRQALTPEEIDAIYRGQSELPLDVLPDSPPNRLWIGVP